MIDYRPDWPPQNGILQTATHVIPDKYGQYRTSFGAASMTNWTSAASDTHLAARIVRKSDGTPFLFTGSATVLYEWTSTGPVVVTRSVGGAYSASTTKRWWFAQYGDETLACQLGDTTQTRSGASASLFANHATAPKAKIMLVQSGHLLALNYNDGAAVPNGIKWASQGATSNWTAGTSNTAGAATLVESPGEITAGAEIHDIVAVWKRSSMYVGRRIGGAEIWRFNLLSPKIGCPGPEAWVSTPVGIIFASSSSGIYKFDGSTPVAIDDGVRTEIYSNFAASPSVILSHDEASGCVFVWNGYSSTIAWTYNYISNKWSKGYGTSTGATTPACMVRDSIYDDMVAINSTSTNGQRRSHLFISTTGVIQNLANTIPANGLSPAFVFNSVRHSNAGPRDQTIISRVTPVFNWSSEQTYYEPVAGTLTHAYKDRPGTGTTIGSGSTASLDAMKGFDLTRNGNTHYVQMDFANEELVLADVVFDWMIQGKR